MIQNAFGFIVSPKRQWNAVRSFDADKAKRSLAYLLIMPALPAGAFFIGTTRSGWEVGDRLIKITTASALPLSLLFYLTMIIATVVMGVVIHWMATTYGAESRPIKGVLTAAFAGTPIFIAGIAGVYPIFWLDILLATAAISYTAYLLYLGIEIMMEIQKERVFLFTASVGAAAMVLVVSVMGGTTMIWQYLARPIFIE